MIQVHMALNLCTLPPPFSEACKRVEDSVMELLTGILWSLFSSSNNYRCGSVLDFMVILTPTAYNLAYHLFKSFWWFTVCLPLTQFAPPCFVPFLFIGRKKKKTEVIVICIVVGVVDWIM